MNKEQFQDVLEKHHIPIEFHAAFVEYCETGQVVNAGDRGRQFLAALETNEQYQDAIEEVFDKQAKAFEGFAHELREERKKDAKRMRKR